LLLYAVVLVCLPIRRVFDSTDRGNSWRVIWNYLPPVYAVTFAP